MSIPLKPRMSEKAYGLSEAQNVYVFDVPKDANRLTVATAVNEQFKVTVEAVNVANVKGKVKRSFRKNGRFVRGQRSDVKKAYVTVKKGENIPIFAAMEEAAAKEEATQEKIDKAVAKQAVKETKPRRRGLRRAKKAEDE